MKSKTYVIAPPDELRDLCIFNNWFGCGTSRQYGALFYANEDDFTVEQMATIIWLCSSDDWSFEEICDVLNSYVSEERR